MLISKYGNAEKKDILAICQKLPEDFVTFLEKYNGGDTPETSFSTAEISSDIVAFYGIGNVKYSYSSITPFEADGSHFLPIAFDSFGNQIVMNLENGMIAFLDHEKNAAPMVLADSFKSFLSLIKSKPIDPKHTKPVAEREKEMRARGKGANISDALRALWQNEIDKYSGCRQEEVLL